MKLLNKVKETLEKNNLEARKVQVMFLEQNNERHELKAWLEFSGSRRVVLKVEHDGYALDVLGGIEFFRQLVKRLKEDFRRVLVVWAHRVYADEGWESSEGFVEILEYRSLDDSARPISSSRDWTFRKSELEHDSYSNPFNLSKKRRQRHE